MNGRRSPQSGDSDPRRKSSPPRPLGKKSSRSALGDKLRNVSGGQGLVPVLPAPSSYVSASSILSSSPHRSGNQLGRSLPKRINSPVPTTHSHDTGDIHSPYGTPMSDAEVAKLVSEHLVQAGPSVQDIDEEDQGGPSNIGSVSHNLLGGDVTRDVYQWQEKQEKANHRRRNSEPNLFGGRDMIREGSFNRASDFHTPGMFRRHFVRSKAQREGKRPPNMITGNFIDFLALYGFYGGDVYPSDDDSDEEDLEEGAGFPPLGGVGGFGNGGPGHVEDANETTPLVRSRTPSMATIQGTSQKKAFFMLLKAFVGTGVLFLPKAFANGGMGFSIILMVVIGFLTLHCMLLLVDTSRQLGGSFGDLGEKLYGPRVRQLVLASIAISQAGFCCAYYIFVAQNLRDLLRIVSNCTWDLPDWFFIVLQLAIYIPLSWVRKIKHFSHTSLIADVFIIAGLSYIFYHDFFVVSKNGAAPGLVWFNLESFPLFVGTAMFAFEGICLILPIAESMKKPEKFSFVLTMVVLTIGIIFVSIGAIGYLAFGPKVETVVFLNLPKGPHVSAIQFFYAIAIILSFPLTVYPTIRITEHAMFEIHQTGKSSPVIKWQKNAYRALLVGLLAGVSYWGSDNLDKFVSLVGCFACIPLSFIYPSLFHWHIARSRVEKWKDMALVLFGTGAMVYTTYVTIEQWATGGKDVPRDRCKP
ncbi:neutral amino acid transporter [Rhizophlyctis rosea]|nr:neutral amino acid transporter [Rhizophlyctis rosea]